MADTSCEPWRLLEGRFAFNSHTGEFFLMNPTGAKAFRLAITGASADDVAQVLTSEERARPDVAQRDAEQFLVRLRQLGLLKDAPQRTGSNEVKGGKKKRS